MERVDNCNLMNNPDVIKDIYLDDQGLGTLDEEGDITKLLLMMDSMASSSKNFFQELGVAGNDGLRANGWKYDDDNLCNVVLVDHVDQRNLERITQLCDLTIQKAKLILGIA